MTTKTLEEVKKLAKGYDLVPIQEEILPDLVTPIQLIKKNRRQEKRIITC